MQSEPLPDGRSEEPRRFVLEWQGPVYNYLRRALGNDADAADVTQEVFIRALRHITRTYPERPGPWVFRIAANALRNHLRDRKTRRDQESRYVREKLGNDDPLDADGARSAETEEERQRVLDELAKLPAEERALLSLQYFSGLSQREIAETLSVPRTTIADRLRRALSLLRSRLEVGGSLTVLPGLEDILRTTAPLEVPPTLGAALLDSAATASAAAVSSGVTIGGLVVSKKIAAAILVVVLAAGFSAGGWILGDRLDPQAGARAEHLRSALDAERTRSSELVASNARLEEEIARLRGEGTRLRHEMELQAESLLHERDRFEAELARRSTDDGGEDGVEAGLEGELRLDWTRIEGLLAKHPDLFPRLSAMVRERHEPSSLDREDQLRFQEIILEWNKLAAEARVHSDYPIFDERVLPDLLRVFFEGTTGLDDAQAESLARRAGELLAEFQPPRDATPLEAHAARRQLMREIDAHVESLLGDGDQRERYESVHALWKHIAEGRRVDLAIGLRNGGRVENIQRAWTDLYGLTPEQRGGVAELASSYAEDANRLFDRHGAMGDAAKSMTAASRDMLDDELERLRFEYEERVLPRLTPEQMDALPGRVPVIVRFGDWGYVSWEGHEDLGF